MGSAMISEGMNLGFQDASAWDSAWGGFSHATVFAPPGLDFEGEKLDSPGSAMVDQHTDALSSHVTS